MNRPKRFIYLLLPLILVGLVYGVYNLLSLRFEQGDIYPLYSSLRADPLGTKAFYEGLQEMKGLMVSRNYATTDQIQSVTETTYFDLGDYPEEVLDVPVEAAPDIQSYLLRGGRLIITFVGENGKEGSRKKSWLDQTMTSPTTTPTVTPSATPSNSQTPITVAPVKPPTPRPTLSPTPTAIPAVTFGQEWGVKADSKPLAKNETEAYDQVTTRYLPVTVLRGEVPGIPAKLPWHSALYFKKLDPSWKVLYQREGDPVAITRRFGKGSLILLTDSYLISNEAMLKDRHANFLAYLIGDRRRVVFDETHLGVSDSDNMATLARKYGLGGFCLGLLVLALLFVWRNSMSLVPPPKEESAEQTGLKSGKDFSSGLVNLLKRNIPQGDILAAAFAQWKGTFARERKHLKPKVEEMEKELSRIRAEKNIHPVEGYVRLRRILKKKK